MTYIFGIGRYQWATETKKRYGWQGRKYYTTVVSLICGHLPPKANPLIRPPFRCTDLDKYYLIVPLNRDHPRQPVFALSFMTYIFGIMKADKKIIVYIFLKTHRWSNG
jgi:hypothetical protein